jgi:hypothetical protein
MKEKKKKDPWTDPDPQPGDFDDVLDETESVEMEFDPDLEIRIIGDEEYVRLVGPERAEEMGVVVPRKKSAAG